MLSRGIIVSLWLNWLDDEIDGGKLLFVEENRPETLVHILVLLHATRFVLRFPGKFVAITPILDCLTQCMF